MSKPKAIQASAAETALGALGNLQSGIASNMKNRLSGVISKIAQRDDSDLLRRSANAGVEANTNQALAQTTNATQRAAVVSSGVNAGAKAGSDANVAARGAIVDRMGSAIKAQFGAQEASVSSVNSLAKAQNNAAFTVADAKMRNTAATMAAVGNAVSTYGAISQDMAKTNAINQQSATNAGMTYYDKVTNPFTFKTTSMPIGLGKG